MHLVTKFWWKNISIGLRLDKEKQWKNVLVALILTRCIPWFYPVPDNSSIKMCDPWEAKAFQNLIGKVPPELCNHCLPDCNKNIFRASVSAAPFRICDHTNLGTRYGQKAFLFCWHIFLWKGHYFLLLLLPESDEFSESRRGNRISSSHWLQNLPIWLLEFPSIK